MDAEKLTVIAALAIAVGAFWQGLIIPKIVFDRFIAERDAQYDRFEKRLAAMTQDRDDFKALALENRAITKQALTVAAQRVKGA